MLMTNQWTLMARLSPAVGKFEKHYFNVLGEKGCDVLLM